MVDLVCPHCRVRGKSVNRSGQKLVGKGLSRIQRSYACSCGRWFSTNEAVTQRNIGEKRPVTAEMVIAATYLRGHGYSWNRIGRIMDVNRERIRWECEREVTLAKRRAAGPEKPRPEARAIYRKRSYCRQQAVLSGRPVVEFYQAFDCVLPKDLVAA